MASPSEFTTNPVVQAPFETKYRYPTTQYKGDPSQKMIAAQWFGAEDVRPMHVPKPMITDPTDAIVRITSTTICGSDLHMYLHEVKEMDKGFILGHEFMGIIEQVGPDVKEVKQGDRVVVSAVIADGCCFYCKNGWYSCCDNTNPNKEVEKLYGQRLSGIFGYSRLTGGYPGGQAEYARIPIADFNCLKVPSSLPDEKVLFLSDIACTGWHANEFGQVSPGQTVAIWGCGPVGLMATMWAKFRGASRVIVIDNVPVRLDLATKKLGAETINFDKCDVVETLKQMCPHGPDVCIETAGFRFPKSTSQKVQRTTGIETDSSDILREMIISCRKAGNIAIIGDYFKDTNQFPIGAMMEKGLTVKGSQVYVQKYWKQLLGYIERGLVDPSFIITHTMPLEKIDEAYKMFNKKLDNCIKVLIKPSMTQS